MYFDHTEINHYFIKLFLRAISYEKFAFDHQLTIGNVKVLATLKHSIYHFMTFTKLTRLERVRKSVILTDFFLFNPVLHALGSTAVHIYLLKQLHLN